MKPKPKPKKQKIGNDVWSLADRDYHEDLAPSTSASLRVLLLLLLLL